ncbi:sphingosine 1-phosphate receptor 1-like [Mercenaria mercenaria]|uniref:sphingosine 1-phosphate receptor 1-like n=1 Tax=Mercenaria mercenaria TaxID=6596 RepID=UPI00234F1097|nr:sphingosine 1-phosphate receptor 1-like [Mercenaria mercenaria]
MEDGKNFSNVDLSCLFSPTFNIVSVTIHVIVSTATIFGNALILISIYKYPIQFKGSLYMFIGNLAVADLLLGVWLLLFIYEGIVPEVQNNWYFCVAKPVGVVTSYCCSIFSLLGISFDRFMAIIFPLEHLVKTHKRKLFIISITAMWIISITSGTLPVILEPHGNTFVCRMGAILPQDFQLVCSIVLLLVVFINFVLYGIVMWKVKTKRTPGNSGGRKKSSKTVLMIIVFLLFVICWLPFITCSIIMHFSLEPSTFQNVICAREYLAKLGYINCALNCVIYGLANKKFRAAFKKILFCKRCPTFSKPSSFLSERGRANSMCNEMKCSVDQKQDAVE